MSLKKITLSTLFSLLLAVGLSGCFSTEVLEDVTSSSSSSESSSSSADISGVYLFTSDYTTGELRWMPTGDSSLAGGPKVFHQDSKLAAFGGDLYLLERFGADNIVRYDVVADSVLYQYELEDGANPVDMAFVSENKAYISLENSAELLIFDPSVGEKTGSIDLSGYVFEGQSTPHADHMLLQGTRLYLILQRRNGWTPGDVGMVLVINTETDKVEKEIELLHKNPVSIVTDGTDIFVSIQGSLPFEGSIEPDGSRAVEKLDLTVEKSVTVLNDSTLGGAPGQLVYAGGSTFYVQVYVSFGNMPVKKVDLASGKVVESIEGVVNAFGGLAYDSVNDLLYIGEQNPTASGLVTWDGSTLSSPLASEELPPYDVLIVD